MPKNKITDYNTNPDLNLDIGGVSIANGCDFGNMNDAAREAMAHLAEMNAGTEPLADTVTFGDPADLTKQFRTDAGSITSGMTRVYTAPNASGTIVLDTMAQKLSNKNFADPNDLTKIMMFNLGNITTATTRTVTVPDSSGTMMLASLYPTVTSLEELVLVAGDILYATAENTLARLPKGTDGQILKIGASAPSWVDDTALVKIESKAAIGASIAFINLAGYAYVELVFDSVVFSDVNSPFIRLSTDNGASYASAAASYRGAVGNDETGINSDTEININDDPTLGADSGRLCLSYFNAIEKTVVDGLLRVGTKIDKVVARRSVAEVNNAILFSASAGTMTSGTVTAWGRKR